MNVRGACACFVVVTIRTGLRQTLIGKTIDFLIVGYTIVDIKIQERNKKKRCLNSLRPSTPFSCFHTRFTQIQQRRENREKETGRRKHFERSPENRKRVTWTKEEKKTNRRLFSFLAFFFLFLSRFDVAAVVAVESYIMVASLHNIILYIQHTDTHFGRGK